MLCLTPCVRPTVCNDDGLMRQLWRDKAFHNEGAISSQIKGTVMTQAAMANVSYITVLMTNFNEAEEGELSICLFCAKQRVMSTTYV